jgi:hypothetical protein
MGDITGKGLPFSKAAEKMQLPTRVLAQCLLEVKPSAKDRNPAATRA